MKYKRCCLGRAVNEVDVDVAAGLHELDNELTVDVCKWALRTSPDRWEEAVADGLGDYVSPEDMEPVEFAVVLGLARSGGQTLLERYAKARSSYLASDVRAWIDSLSRAWLSLWEVTAVEPGIGLDLHDLLTGESCSIIERSMSMTVSRRDVVCGRVVTASGVTVLAGTDSQSLRSLQAESVIGEFLQVIDTAALPIEPERLRGEAGLELLSVWQAACREAANGPPPRLQNRDGHVLQATTDVFSFDAGDAAKIDERLRTLDGVEESGEPGESYGPGTESVREEDAINRYVVVRPEDETIVAFIRLHEDTLEVETNSEARSDELRDRIEALLGERIGHAVRERQDMQDFMASRMSRSDGRGPTPEPQGPEVDALLRQFKETQYESWPDTALPMLGGKTPRQVMPHPAERRKVVAVIKDIEASESRVPTGQRYDVGILRRALGISEDE